MKDESEIREKLEKWSKYRDDDRMDEICEVLEWVLDERKEL